MSTNSEARTDHRGYTRSGWAGDPSIATRDCVPRWIRTSISPPAVSMSILARWRSWSGCCRVAACRVYILLLDESLIPALFHTRGLALNGRES